jgi:DNA-binding transcriptional LysR family regulator
VIRYSLRQLEYLIAAANAASIAGAAMALNVSQPSVSAAIAKLEEQLGTQLLIRHHAQGVSLSPAGSRLVAAARNLLTHAEELQRQAGAAGQEIAGTLQIASFVTIAAAYLPAVIAQVPALHPRVTIALQEGTQDELIEGLRGGRHELAVLYDVDLPEDLAATPLAAFEPYALLPARHPLARRRKVSLGALANEPLILLDVPPSRQYFLGLFHAEGLEPKIGFSSPSLELVRGLVGRGLGYSVLVTRPHGDRTYEGEPVAVRPLSEKGRMGEIVLARLKQLRPTRTMLAFEDHCIGFFRQHRP